MKQVLLKALLITLTTLFAPQVYAQESLDSSIFINDLMIYFDSDSHLIDDEGRNKIDSLSEEYIDDQEVFFLIEAHTDQVGSVDYNIELSKRREGSVKSHFINAGSPDSCLISQHFGESKLAVKDIKEASNRLNRRVRISVFKRKKLIEIKGRVIDKESKLPLIAEINLSTEDFNSVSQSDSSGKFSLLSPLDEKVNLDVLAPNYFIESNSILISEKHRDIILKVPLPKLELGKKYLFKNMLFKGNLSIMIEASERSAFQLKRFMDLHPEVCIEIGGHVNYPMKDSVGRSTSQFELSVARAIEIKNQLISEGVSASRMLARGYGNWEMKFPKTSIEHEMAMNRRVEIGIITCGEAEEKESDEIEDLERYRKSNFRRNYKKRLVETDVENTNYRLRILLQVASMIEKGMDPNKYTYKEIFDAYPELPPLKEED